MPFTAFEYIYIPLRDHYTIEIYTNSQRLSFEFTKKYGFVYSQNYADSKLEIHCLKIKRFITD